MKKWNWEQKELVNEIYVLEQVKKQLNPESSYIKTINKTIKRLENECEKAGNK